MNKDFGDTKEILRAITSEPLHYASSVFTQGMLPKALLYCS